MPSRKEPTPSFVLELEFDLVDVPRVTADKKGRGKDSTAGNVDATTSANRAIVGEYDR